MIFEIKFSRKAEEDIQRTVNWWGSNHSRAEAETWYLEAIESIESLANIPTRCPVVRNTIVFGQEVRQLLFGFGAKITHRVYFGIEGQTVIIFRVLSTHQQLPLKPSEL